MELNVFLDATQDEYEGDVGNEKTAHILQTC
jgi:hypothetical protein